MYGVVTRNEAECTWPDFDRSFYEAKSVTGRSAEPVSDAVNMVSCFADNAAADADPSLVPVDDLGRPATRDRPYFDWAHICPTREEYREGLFDVIDDCVEQSPDVRLDDVGFPREEYCRCGFCEEAFAASETDDWLTWRTEVVTSFVADAAARIPGELYLTLYPDPYPGHLERRAGLDLGALAAHVDEFVVPLYDTAYETTYWLETIAKGFETALETPFAIELYAAGVDLDNVVRAAEVARAYGDGVYFGYDGGTSRAAVRRIRADERDGVTHGDPGS